MSTTGQSARCSSPVFLPARGQIEMHTVQVMFHLPHYSIVAMACSSGWSHSFFLSTQKCCAKCWDRAGQRRGRRVWPHHSNWLPCLPHATSTSDTPLRCIFPSVSTATRDKVGQSTQGSGYASLFAFPILVYRYSGQSGSGPLFCTTLYCTLNFSHWRPESSGFNVIYQTNTSHISSGYA